jgi:transcriptional antiterminator RfaH
VTVVTGSFPSESAWHVVQVHLHAERKAQMHLSRQGFETYLPLYMKRRRHARRTDTVAAPLYPSYLFVRFNSSIHRWRSIHSTIGVVRLVCNGDLPAALDQAIIENLKSRQNTQGFIELDRRPKFALHDKVRISDGIFADCLGLVEGVSDRDRVVILLNMLGRKVRVLLDEELVVAA